ncbi:MULTISPECIES: hypothetical protein [unclassified Chelatococcus]|uniref:hypothetical protein n=1 Tax=unclassified Chelatococcus TaxID=2638111 RepID=UPI001BD1B6AD|nr:MULTISPECIES: hypothetical protein [unclassified Chelatococcus]MBS7696053.1 hypothetical protein [Chelatococcus sp. YT9]MBX3558036.1 hypothetical protein [Chelatococcus sp.]
MPDGLGFVSFDFDLTVTRLHTWTDCGIDAPLLEGDPRLGLVAFQNGPLLIGLVRALCGNGLAVCITSRQYAQTIFHSLKANPGGDTLIADFHGSRFFIFGRESVGISKARTLADAFGTNVGGLHFDDDPQERQGLFENHHFCLMEAGTSFSLDNTGGLMRGLGAIPRLFAGLLTVDLDPRYTSVDLPLGKYPALARGPAPWRERRSLSPQDLVAHLNMSLMSLEASFSAVVGGSRVCDRLDGAEVTTGGVA